MLDKSVLSLELRFNDYNVQSQPNMCSVYFKIINNKLHFQKSLIIKVKSK